jgi:large subunit ribosomal protein L29
MKMTEIRKLSTPDLTKKVEENKKELFNLKFSASTGNLEKPHRIKELRHEVAKIKTVIRERELGESKEEK